MKMAWIDSRYEKVIRSDKGLRLGKLEEQVFSRRVESTCRAELHRLCWSLLTVIDSVEDPCRFPAVLRAVGGRIVAVI